MSVPASLPESLLDGRAVRRLGEHAPGTLQVLLTDFGLERQGAGLVLDVTATSDTPGIRGRAGKRALAAAVARSDGAAERRLQEELTAFAGNPGARRFDCADHPLRWANAGVLPILRVASREYFALFLREIPPVGWNLANGASDDTDDLRDPNRIAARELAEELIVWCPEGGPKEGPNEGALLDLVGEAQAQATDAGLRAWTARLPELAGAARRPCPVHWIDGPDRVRADVLGSVRETAGWFLAITPEDNAIEVDRVARVDVPGDLRLLDGELTPGGLLDRIVGLFPVDETLEQVTRAPAGAVLPARVFRSGVERDPAELDVLVEEYFDDLAARGLGTADERRAHARLAHHERYRLCPVARSVVARGPHG